MAALKILIESETVSKGIVAKATAKLDTNSVKYVRRFPIYFTAAQIQEKVAMDLFLGDEGDVWPTAPTVTDTR